MVFFIVAIGDKKGDAEATAEQRLKTQCPSFSQDRRPGAPEVHRIKVRSHMQSENYSVC